MTRKLSINWFRLNRYLHRDFGYLAIGLTIVFAVSGIAVNHIDDWNPNYQVERIEKKIYVLNSLPEPELNEEIIQLFSINQAIKASYWETSQHYKLFLGDGGTLSANFINDTVVYEKISERVVLKQFNTIHLNEVKYGWIIFSDIYAGILLFLAISSLFMVKGKYSPWRPRKGWLVLLGIFIPTIYMFV